ncbi:glycosyltransferase family 2 protein [Sphingomonas sp. QA11]|nr:glycosyltransferase family 2 protein [Sphingomonas sp. QA11]WCM25711.1 glycosyltransferase family 2 protein [Sphingomonas sp. QA11]
MPSHSTGPKPAKGAIAWLLLSIHLAAFRAAPWPYLEALWCRICGKRVRARGKFAPLLEVSSKSYALWLLREEAIGKVGGPPEAKPPIWALIDVRADQAALDATLCNMAAEGVRALVVGTEAIPTLAEAARHIDWSEGPWLMPIMAGDMLAPGAASAYHAALAGLDARIVYADDDLLDAKGHRTAPHFKPDWNSELFRHFDYLTGACIVRAPREVLEDGADADDWAYRLVVQAADEGTPLHLRRVLHHRHARRRPAVPTGIALSPILPPVCIIVPTRNRVDLLRTCLSGIAATDYPDLEVIVVDNDSDDPETLAYLAALDPARHRVLHHAGAFNYSAINNRAVAEARGRMLCLLNNDVEMIGADWLAIMVTQALREDVGAVGAQLLYPDGRIQHAGVVTGVGRAAGHAHRFVRPEAEGYFRRHALPQFTSAVTAACLVVERDRFLAVGGLDERNFAVAFNDVDLCLRLNERGWQSLYEPRARLIHHESVSRGLDRDPVGVRRFAGELAALKARWGTDESVDPFHHPELSLYSERFVVGL